ncbi:MAG: Uma2 family endonuclease [Spirosomataceae bacterium]
MVPETLVSVEEYFELLHKSDVKLEYNAGEIVAMAGAQPPHNIIVSNINYRLMECLLKKGCIVFNSDQLIKVEGCEKYTFPDLVIVCTSPVYEKSLQGLDALLNPEIIVEVLLESTESYDRTTKFDCYKTIASFREYVLISSKKKRIEVHKKLNDAEWLSRVYTDKDAMIKVDDCELLLENLYYAVEFD